MAQQQVSQQVEGRYEESSLRDRAHQTGAEAVNRAEGHSDTDSSQGSEEKR